MARYFVKLYFKVFDLWQMTIYFNKKLMNIPIEKFKNISLSNSSSFYEKKQVDSKGKNLYTILQ
jgi:hypothetical protein